MNSIIQPSHPIIRYSTGLLISMVLFFVLTFSYYSWASNSLETQIQIRAAYIYKMAKFINWSIHPQVPLTFCFLNDGSADKQSYSVTKVLSALETAGKLKLQQRDINIKIIDHDKASQLPEYRLCSLVYFAQGYEPQLTKTQMQQLSKTKLTIGSNTEFMRQGGLCTLILEKDRLKLYINRSAYDDSKVRIRSRLLALARFYPK